MSVRIINADVMEGLRQLPDESVHCVVTSPPYFGLRDYGVDGQIGLEPTPDAFVTRLVDVFREVRRVLRGDGTLWVNMGDSYNSGSQNNAGKGGTKERPGLAPEDGWAGHRPLVPGLKPKDLIGVPWMLAFALRADGWWLRSDIIWHKPNPMPESVTDRPTKAHEYVFLLTKSERYFYDASAIAEVASEWSQKALAGAWSRKTAYGTAEVSGRNTVGANYADRVRDDGKRNKRSVWTIATAPFAEAHFATFPPEIPEICIKAGCPVGGTVLDPFGGAGTTGLVADRLQRNAILIEINPEYAAMAERRIHGDRGELLDIMEAAE